MALSPGTRLGPYEILSPIGAGGMGEVYKARDTRLDRIVAVKVLHSTAAPDAARQERFEREARAVSALNHPHICTLHDVGEQDGVAYLVMEHLEGETLAQRLEKGALPLDLLLPIATQIADALARAHRQGVVHRDLKPANIMLTRSGAKLLDFGLAKLAAAPITTAEPGLSALPTMQRTLTAEGSIVGTLQYMAPEQLEGKEADARTDIFAFGAILFEMATGKRAFEAKSQASLITAIMSSQPPPLSSVEPLAPTALDRLLRACLAKDPDDRIQTAHDVKLQLSWIAEAPEAAISTASAPAASAPRAGRERRWMLACAGLALLAAGFGGAALLARRSVTPPPPMRFIIPTTDQVTWRPWNSMSLSPDGQQVVLFGDGADGTSGFWLRSLDSFDLKKLPGTDVGNASFPFWSPDSRTIGFFAYGKLKRVDITGGPPLTIADAPDGRGGAWFADGTILFAPKPGAGLMRVPASGGDAVVVTTPDATKEPGGHAWPSPLDGDRFTYLSLGASSGEGWLMSGSLGSTESRKLLASESVTRFLSPGTLLFVRQGTLLAQAFDPKAVAVIGDPVSVATNVSRNIDTGYAAFDASLNGTVIYKGGSDSLKQFMQVDRTGRHLKPIGPEGDIGGPRFSPDGTRLVFERVEADAVNADIWVADLVRGISQRLTFEPTNEASPVWSIDGTEIFYYGEHAGTAGVYRKAANGSGTDTLVIEASERLVPQGVTPDGKQLICGSGNLQGEIMVLPLSPPGGAPHPFITTPFDERRARLSPDGRWLAYDADPSGLAEVFVQPFPGPGGKWQVSTAGGVQAAWRGDGKEMYYLAPDRTLFAVPVEGKADSFEVGTPKALFRSDLPVRSGRLRYVPTPDGQGFIIATAARDATSPPIQVIVNWPGIGK
jgi:Tol biopolymer transport system component